MHPITIRFPDEVAAEARQESEARGKSINQYVVEAVAEVNRRRRLERLSAAAARLRAEIEATHGISSPSEPLIRQLRQGIGRRD